jgi:hypothetical protein
MKSRTVVIVIDGVLRKVIGNDPIPDGLILFSALASKFSVVLLSAKDGDVAWLAEQGVQYDMLFAYQDTSHADRVDTLRFEYGYDIAFVVEPDPAQGAQLFKAGYTVLGFTHPYYSHPSWRPLDGSETPAETWTELRGVVVRDRLMRASDERTATRDE